MGDLHDALDDLAGFGWIPGIDAILTGVRTVADAAENGALSLDGTQTLLTLTGNPYGPDLTTVLSLLAAHITHPDTNRALRDLPGDTQKTVQHLGELHVFETAELAPRDYPNEAAGLISAAADWSEGRAQTMTHLDDDQHKALSDKVAKANKQSTNRPR